MKKNLLILFVIALLPCNIAAQQNSDKISAEYLKKVLGLIDNNGITSWYGDGVTPNDDKGERLRCTASLIRAVLEDEKNYDILAAGAGTSIEGRRNVVQYCTESQKNVKEGDCKNCPDAVDSTYTLEKKVILQSAGNKSAGDNEFLVVRMEQDQVDGGMTGGGPVGGWRIRVEKCLGELPGC